MNKKVIFWFRQDLRLADNPGLFEAAKAGIIMPIFILDETLPKLGGASKYWLHHSLLSLNKSLSDKLNFYLGSAEEIISNLLKEHEISAIYCNKCFEPKRDGQDANIKNILSKKNVEFNYFNASLLWEPDKILKSDNTPYKVFTPYYRNGCLKYKSPRETITIPKNLSLAKDELNKTNLNDLKLLDHRNWHHKFDFPIGEEEANRKLDLFIEIKLKNYKENRNFPSLDQTSKLSPHLHFGEISPNQIWQKVNDAAHHINSHNNIDHYLSELGWREFSYYLLHHFPDLPFKNFQAKFNKFPWQYDDHHLSAWKKGQTGFPIIDAGMRELWNTGIMHNDSRIIFSKKSFDSLALWHESFLGLFA